VPLYATIAAAIDGGGGADHTFCTASSAISPAIVIADDAVGCREDGTMADIAVENYKKAVAKAVARWGDKIEQASKKARPVLDELEQLKDLKLSEQPAWLSDAVKKRMVELRKQIEDLKKTLDTSAIELRADIMLLSPPNGADPKEIKGLPPWLEEIIKKEGLPLGKTIAISPDVDIDLKTMKIKKLAITFKVELP
jgi:hypothetical protein